MDTHLLVAKWAVFILTTIAFATGIVWIEAYLLIK